MYFYVEILFFLNWFIKYHLLFKNFKLKNEPFIEIYLLNRSMVDTHVQKV